MDWIGHKLYVQSKVADICLKSVVVLKSLCNIILLQMGVTK